MEEIKEGDVVVLKSGGPMMTIEYIDRVTSQVACTWIDQQEKQQRGTFNPKALKPADEE